MQRVGAERQGGGGGAFHFAGNNQIQHAVLQHFRVAQQIVERRIHQAGQHGIGHVAHAGLQRQQVFRQAAGFYFVAEEIDNLRGNAFGHFVRLGKFAVAVAGIREDDGDDFVQIAVDIRYADTVERMEDVDGFAERRRADVGLDIVHAVQFDVLRQVDFNDDFLGNFDRFVGVADAHCRDDFSVFRNGAGFDDGHIELTVKTLAHLLFDM